MTSFNCSESFLGEPHISEALEAAPALSRKACNVLNVFNYTQRGGLSITTQQGSSSQAPGEFSRIKDENVSGSFWPMKIQHVLGEGKKVLVLLPKSESGFLKI